MKGRFIIHPDTDRQIIVENNVLDEGEIAFLQMIWQARVADVAAGGNFFIGLCGAAFAENTTLATLVGEPTVTNGYARQPIARNTTGWPTVSEVNGIKRAQSALITFTPSGGDFSASIQRMFICNVVSGTAGLLFAVSGALPAAVLITLAGGPFTSRYESYLR